MPKKSWWESPFWKAVGALAALVTIIGFLLQIFGGVDVYKLIIVPIINFFTIPIPLYSIPLTFVIVIVIVLIMGSMNGSKSSASGAGTVSASNIFDDADILDDVSARYVTVLCKTPQTTDFLKTKYEEFRRSNDFRIGHSSSRYSFEDCMKQLEYRELLLFESEKWIVTQKALDYIAKYHV